MNIKDFKRWLEQFPDDTIVEVLVQEDPKLYESFGEAFAKKFTAEEFEDYEFVDFTGNRFVTPDKPYFGKRFLILGVGT